MPAATGCDGLRVGEVAAELGVPLARVRWWLKRGFVRADGLGRGHGRYGSIPRLEVEVARRVLEEQRRLGVDATEGLFAYARSHTSLSRAACP